MLKALRTERPPKALTERESRQSAQMWWNCTTKGSAIMLVIILIVLFVAALAGGGWSHSRYGYASWSPAGLLLLVFLLIWFTGHLHV